MNEAYTGFNCCNQSATNVIFTNVIGNKCFSEARRGYNGFITRPVLSILYLLISLCSFTHLVLVFVRQTYCPKMLFLALQKQRTASTSRSFVSD